MSISTDVASPEIQEKIRQARTVSNQEGNAPIYTHHCIGELLTARATATPDQNWLTFYNDDGKAHAYVYAEFYETCRRTANMLASRFGVGRGHRVATLMLNDPRTVFVYFGAWLLGATIVPINCGEDDARVTYILENSEATVVIVHEEQNGRIPTLKASLPTLQICLADGGNNTDGMDGFLELLQAYLPLDPLLNIPSDAECLIIYTSGTTGAPKGVVLDHGNLLADAHSIAEWNRFSAEDRAMCILPIHHVNGIIVTLMTPLYTGGSVVLHRRFRTQSFWKTLAEERCTWVSVVPTILAFLSERAENLGQYDLSRFRHFICGAGPLTVETIRRFDTQFGLRVVHGYGLSETTCYSCYLPIDLGAQAYRYWMMECGFPSIGCPISANDMAIHDSQGQALPEEVRGEIVIRGQNVMQGYFKRPDANRDAFTYGWFRSGDEGFFKIGEDGQHYFFITGRIKELIIRGGINYSPFDIDEVLNAIPGVKAAMAVGFEHHIYGEEVGAYVQLEPGAVLTEEEILRRCRERLSFAKSPKVVVFGDTFPVTSTGKYQRNRLKPLFSSWNDTQFREKG